MFTGAGRYLNSTQFNGLYGGKQFIITDSGKTTDEPWKAALRSSKWTVPKVDHVRFLPDRKPFELVRDSMGRLGVNTYIEPVRDEREGDITLFHDWLAKTLPDEGDRKIWCDYMAHNVKYPGFKIPWAPLLQSAEGVGKTAIHMIMSHALGKNYVYSPKAPELVNSGSKFNAWMRAKLCIIVDEIKIDERRELIEILKPMITDSEIEIQAKGVDQEMEDNVANWIFFSNFKDAIPINKNGRRYSVFYSQVQTEKDIEDLGLDTKYFKRMRRWLLEEGGCQAMSYWLRNYPLEKGDIPMRAPKTSCYTEAVRISRTPMEIIIDESIEDKVQGFRGGYVSSIAVTRAAKTAGIRSPSAQTIRSLLEGKGYIELGRATDPYSFESATSRATIYADSGALTLDGFAAAQGYTV
jgi:hypothetical protein